MSDAEPVGAPVVGFRAWAVGKAGYGLEGLLMPLSSLQDITTTWATGEATARCTKVDAEERRERLHRPRFAGRQVRSVVLHHDAPHAECGCGLYAWKMLLLAIQHIEELAAARVPHKMGEKMIVGAVVAWGTVQESEFGFKAQHMRVLAFLDGDYTTELRRVCERYELPALDAGELVQYARWFGETLPARIALDRGPLAH
jgi:hypothetical protein